MTAWAPVGDAGDHVRRARTEPDGRVGAGRAAGSRAACSSSTRTAGSPPHPQRRRPLRRQRLFARWRSTCSPRRAAPARSRGEARGRRRRSGSARPPQRFDDDMKAARDRARASASPRKTPLAAIGFCFGGGMIWRLLAAEEPRLSAAAPFYGPFPTGGDLRGIKAACSASTAALDARVNATTRRRRSAALEAARAGLRDPHVHRGRPRVLQRHEPAPGSTRRPPRRRG